MKHLLIFFIVIFFSSLAFSSACEDSFSVVTDPQVLRTKLIDTGGEIHQKYIGQEGYIRFADTYFGGNLRKAFDTMSSKMFKRLGWQKFHGSTKEFEVLKAQILDKNGEVREEYIGQEEGYPLFANTYYGGEKNENGNMTKAFLNVSSVLSKEIFQQLGWKTFQGNTNQFHALIMYFKTHSFEDYKGVEGQRQIAELIFENNLRRVYMNVSTLREYLFINKDVFKDLRESGWSITLR